MDRGVPLTVVRQKEIFLDDLLFLQAGPACIHVVLLLVLTLGVLFSL